MRVEKIIYSCDICGNPYDPNDFSKIPENLPTKITVNYGFLDILSCRPTYSCDLCATCAKKLYVFLKTFS